MNVATTKKHEIIWFSPEQLLAKLGHFYYEQNLKKNYFKLTIQSNILNVGRKARYYGQGETGHLRIGDRQVQ